MNKTILILDIKIISKKTNETDNKKIYCVFLSKKCSSSKISFF